MTALARQFASMQFPSEVLKVTVMATVDVTTETDIEKIGQVGTPSCVVSLRSVAWGPATLASAALWNRAGKVEPLSVVWARASVMTGPAADAAGSLRRGVRAEEFSRAPNREDGDPCSDQKLSQRDGLLARHLSVCPIRLHNDP
jgi:hypothetical protein